MTDTLFDHQRASIQNSFADFDREHPEVFEIFRNFATEIRRAGWKAYSADAILHRVRWHHDVGGPNKPGPKINNNFSSRYARKLIEADPTFETFFKTRRLKRS